MRKMMIAALAAAGATLVAPLAARAEPKGIVGAYLCGYGLQRKGCNTSYEEGAKAVRVDETTAIITAAGNRYTKPEAVYQYVMRKAADTTLAAGYDVFTVIQDSDTTKVVSETQGGGSNGNGGVNPVYTFTSIRPGERVMIKFSRGPKSSDASASTFDARDVLKFAEAP
jgi:hypothetical protein